MDQSKFAKIIAILKVAYPYNFKDIDEVEVIALTKLYMEQLGSYNINVIKRAISSIISKSKFMPSVAEIKEECEEILNNYENDILKGMYEAGYFKKGSYKELSDEQALRNYEKATMWVNKGIIPKWLLEDMIAYGYKPELKLETSKNKMVEDKSNGRKNIQLSNN